MMHVWTWVVVVGLVCAVALTALPDRAPIAEGGPVARVLVIAHRGARSVAPEKIGRAHV